MGLCLVLLLYGGIFFPYPADGFPVAILRNILSGVAHASATTIRIWDPSVTVVEGPIIQGRFPMQIVLDCAALDVLALYIAAVLAYPASLRAKLVGASLGVMFLSALNIARIAALYFVGTHAPESFAVVHGDLLAFAMVAATLATFGIWARGRERGGATRPS